MRFCETAISLVDVSMYEQLKKIKMKLLSHFDQNCFYAVVSVPVCEDAKASGVDGAIGLVDEGDIYSGNKLDGWGHVGVLGSAF